MTISSRVMTIAVSAIKPTRANRPVSRTHVRHLTESFTTTTFASAVVLRPITDDEKYQWEVVAGFHRIEGAKLAEQKEIHAVIIEDATPQQLEIIQLDENLRHRQLTPVQEAKAMARRKAIYQEINPAARRGGDRRSKIQVGSLKSFAKATAAATGRSVTAVNRAVARGDRISAEVLKQLQGTPLETGHFMDRLAKLSPDQQKGLVADELAKAKDASDEDGQDAVEKDLSRLRRCWAQACPEAQKKFLNEITASAKKTGADT